MHCRRRPRKPQISIVKTQGYTYRSLLTERDTHRHPHWQKNKHTGRYVDGGMTKLSIHVMYICQKYNNYNVFAMYLGTSRYMYAYPSEANLGWYTPFDFEEHYWIASHQFQRALLTDFIMIMVKTRTAKQIGNKKNRTPSMKYALKNVKNQVQIRII